MSDLLQFKGLVRVEELPTVGMISVRGNLADGAMVAALAAVGLSVPDVRKVAIADGRQVAWMSPDELLVFVPSDELKVSQVALTDALSDMHSLVENVSDMRVRFRLAGAQVRDVLGKVMPVDFAQESFAVGDIRRTRLAQVAAAIWMLDDEVVELICFRSVAQYAFDVLKTSADSEGAVAYYSA